MKQWSWFEGSINRNNEYIEIRFGSAEKSGWDDWIPVAFIQPHGSDAFVAEYCLKKSLDSDGLIMKGLREELDFYLIELGEPNAWNYAKYHAGSTANVYSHYHWSVIPGHMNDSTDIGT